ncbi:MAG: gliding-motility protein MglA [Bdellovibrionales bacterium CG10_big_fil_rev_8_21_14_0_10_45_34]|nr:MAG: gliding-motility protein MglA [Bdellovibrionales bacterium CG10_big_fil_rev_8_21_14_0_10_45_34]
MSVVNYNAKEIHCKIVYYGPSLGGKTTNVQWIYQKTNPDKKSEMRFLPTENERTLFFDFLPLEIGKVQDFTTRFHLYSVPGQIVYDSSRKLVMKGLDGVIFVADSQRERMDENVEALKNLETNLKQQGYDIHQIPLVFQYNKRDLPNALPISELRSKLNRFNAPELEAVASEGSGVFDTLKIISKKILNVLKGGEI